MVEDGKCECKECPIAPICIDNKYLKIGQQMLIKLDQIAAVLIIDDFTLKFLLKSNSHPLVVNISPGHGTSKIVLDLIIKKCKAEQIF